MNVLLALVMSAIVLFVVVCILIGRSRKESYLKLGGKGSICQPAIQASVPPPAYAPPPAASSYVPDTSNNDDSSSSSSTDEGEPNNGGGPDEYGPSPGYGSGL